MDTIENDVPTSDDSADDFDAVEAFARLDGDAAEEQPSKDGTETKDQATEETPDDQQADDADQSDESPETDGDDEAGDESDDEDGTSLKLSDDTKITHKVDGEDREFTLGYLKRLAGQEASLTRKSQEVAAHTKRIDTIAEATVATLEGLLAHAEKQWEPFAKINFLAAAKDPSVSPAELEAAQTAAREAYEHKEYIKAELQQSVERLTAKRKEDLEKAAAECIKVLGEDSEKGIKGWGKEMYHSIRTYAQAEGIDAQVMEELVDPAAYRILHKAMLYDKGKAKVKQVADDKAKQKKAPQKIVKNSQSPKAVKRDTGKEAAFKKLEQTGSLEDAVAAFEAAGL